MKDYNEKIAELNKELEREISYREQYPRLWTLKLDPKIAKIKAKIEQLNELRVEAIEKVKKLQKDIFDIANLPMEAFVENQYKQIQLLGLREYLKQEWNIDVISKEEAISEIKLLKKELKEFDMGENISQEEYEGNIAKIERLIKEWNITDDELVSDKK